MPRMPQATKPSQGHTGSEEVIVGVDTHKDVHVAAVISVLGVLLGTASFPATAAGYQQLLGVGHRVRDAASSRGGVHWLLWGSVDPISAGCGP